jgi:hypothetical protein
MENPILGGGYSCNVCGQYQRTSTLCNHTNLIPTNIENRSINKEDFYKYGESLGIKINDLQRLKMLADICNDKKYTEEDLHTILKLRREWYSHTDKNVVRDFIKSLNKQE